MKKILVNYWPIVTIFLLSLLVTWPLFRTGYFSHHDDLQVMRIFEMRRCFEDLQVPCRFVPDMGFGNGFPLFNYYSVLPYYIGAILSFVTGYIVAAKILFFIPLTLAGFSMYFLAKQLFGETSGFLAAVLYLFAPYRALDSYVRGAVAESFALAIIPLVFYFFLKLIKENTYKNFAFTTISLACFLLSHNIMAMLFLPFLLIWVLYFSFIEKFKNLKQVSLAFLLGIGLTVFFILPAFLETNLVQIDNLTKVELDFRGNFVTFKQLFLDRDWGYGASIPGPNDTISFQIGWPHWWFAVVGGLLLVSLVIRYRRKIITDLSLQKNFAVLFFLILMFCIGIFMTHNKSAFVWEKIGILRFTQFPWRFLSLAIFSASLIAGFVALQVSRGWQMLLVVIAVLLTVGFNFIFFQPETFYPNLTDQQKLSGELWVTQQKAGILDYLPKTAAEPKEGAPASPYTSSGDALISSYIKKSNYFQFNAKVNKEVVMEVPIFDFPNWQVYIDNKNYPHSNNNLLGRIALNLAPGNYLIKGYFQDTPVRIVANVISLVSIFGLIVVYFLDKKNVFK